MKYVLLVLVTAMCSNFATAQFGTAFSFMSLEGYDGTFAIGIVKIEKQGDYKVWLKTDYTQIVHQTDTTSIKDFTALVLQGELTARYNRFKTEHPNRYDTLILDEMKELLKQAAGFITSTSSIPALNLNKNLLYGFKSRLPFINNQTV